MAAGIADTLSGVEDIAALCEAKAPVKRRPYRKAVTCLRYLQSLACLVRWSASRLLRGKALVEQSQASLLGQFFCFSGFLSHQ
jgi:hypothetical protein